MIKDIVVHLTGSAEDEVRLAYAEPIARQFTAHLTGLQVRVIPDLVSYGAPYGASMVGDLLALTEREADEVSERLNAHLARLDISRELRRIDAYAAMVGRELAAEARTADLFIGTRPYGDPTGQTRIEEEVLLGSGRGCLFLPPGGKPPKSYSTILVAWNGSRESARAIAEALPFLSQARETVVAIIEEVASEEHRVEAGADIGRYLSRHDVSSEIRRISGWADAGEAFINEATRIGADMLVMGGYGHSRFRELTLGGATRQALSRATIPVLMAH